VVGGVAAGDRDHPRVSVITAVLNRARTIEATLASVAGQSFRGIEHIVVDGGSTDATLDVVGRAPHHVRLRSSPDHGIFDAFNRGLALARGEWVAFLNSDDVWVDSHVVERALALADAEPDAEVIHGNVDKVDAEGVVTFSPRFVPVPGPDPYADFTWMLPFFQPSSFVRRSLFERIGGFDATFRIASDYDFFCRAWRAGARFVSFPEVLTRMRDDGVSARHPWVCGLESFRISRRHTGALLGPLVELARFEAVLHLEPSAPGLVKAIRTLKHLVKPARTGPLVDPSRRGWL